MLKYLGKRNSKGISFLKNKNLKKWLVFFIALVLVAIIMIPVIWMIRISITPKSELFITPLQWIPSRINLEGFQTLFEKVRLQRYFLNSLIVSTGTLVLSVSVGTLAAYSFSRFKYKGRNVLLAITLMAQMFPWALLVLTLYIFYIKVGLFDTYFGLILAHTTFALPLTIWIVKSYFDTIPREVEESAEIDGCNRFTILFRIIIPLSYPGIIAASIYVFIFSWNDYIFGLTLTSKESMRILSPGIVLSFVGQYQYLWVEMMSSSIIITLPFAAIFIILQKYFISGLTAGAVKQ